MISKSRFTATSAKKQGPIHLHFVCISLILCVSNRNDAKHFIASLHLWHEISFYGDPIESEGIFLLSYFCSKQSIGCIRYMKQNLSKLMKVLNAEYPAEADWQQPRCWTIGLMNTPMCSRQDERMGSLSAGPASQFFFQRQSAFSTSKAENLSFKELKGAGGRCWSPGGVPVAQGFTAPTWNPGCVTIAEDIFLAIPMQIVFHRPSLFVKSVERSLGTKSFK